MSGFWQAVAFLTRFPVPRRMAGESWRKSPPWYPVVGIAVGGLLVLFALTLDRLTVPPVSAVLTLTCWVWITGGLHLDGLMDTVDGFGSREEKARILTIMQDSRVGAMGVLAAILVLGNKLAALAVLHGPEKYAVLGLAPVLGRTAMLAAIYWMPLAKTEGLASTLSQSQRRLSPFLIALAVVIALVPLLQWRIWVMLGLALLVAWWLLGAALRKIGGCTGDTYGALCEWVETAVLIAAALLTS